MVDSSPPSFVMAEQVPDSLHIRLLAMICRPIGAQWNFDDVCSSYWRFYINSRDGAGIELKDGLYPLMANRVHFVPAWVRFNCRNEATPEHFYIHFDLIGLSGALVRDVFNRPFTLPAGSIAERQARRLRTRLRDGVGSDLSLLSRAKGMIYVAIGELIATLPARDRERIERFLFAANPVRPAIAYIEDHLDEKLSNELLADRCALSVDHFARVFQKCVGQTPAQYVIERRIATAAQRLLFGSATIDDIAEQTGFANRFHFSRAFTRRIGVPPAEYRKRSRV